MLPKAAGALFGLHGVGVATAAAHVLHDLLARLAAIHALLAGRVSRLLLRRLLRPVAEHSAILIQQLQHSAATSNIILDNFSFKQNIAIM